MTECQSRYSIMEEFNQKKINARKRLAELDKAVAQEEIKYNQLLQKIANTTSNENNNYKLNFKTWKANQELQIKLNRRNMEETLATMERAIVEKEAVYEDEHKTEITNLEQRKKDTERDYKQFTTFKELDQKAINEEIKEIDSAIESLKSISVAQTS